VTGENGMTNSVIDSARAAAETTERTNGTIVRRAARRAAGTARRSGHAGRTALLNGALVVVCGAAAVRTAAAGTAAQVAVALGGGGLTLAVAASHRLLALRWWLATLVATVGATAIVYVASGDGWPGRTGTVLVSCAVVAAVAAGALAQRRSSAGGVWHLTAGIAAATLVVMPDQPNLHRLGVTVLAITLLVVVARGFSRATLRVMAAALLLAAAVVLAWIGDRAIPSGTSPAAAALSRPDAAAVLDDIGSEADSLRDELPCPRAADRPPDDRLCDALAALEDRADAATESGDTAAVAAATTTLADLRRQVAVRLLRAEDEAPARVELTDAQWRELAGAQAEADAAARPDLRSLMARGVDTVVADALGPALGDRTAARVGDVGWIVLAALLLAGYRRLEILNNRRYGAPIHIDRFVTPAGDDALGAELRAAVRNRVAELDLREPPPVPGARSTVKPMAGIVAALDAVQAPPTRTVRSLLARARGLVFPVPGITVEPTYGRTANAGDARLDGTDGADDALDAGHDDGGDTGQPGGRGAAGHAERSADHVVTVRLRTTQGRRALRAQSFARSSAQAAVDAAADFVVCDSLTNARLTPSWARWHSEDGAALAPYQTVLADTGRTGPRLSLRDQIELLETARAASPGTGLVLVELGHRYDLDERPLDALRTHLTTRALHPRFAQPRYRSAMSLAMLASPVRFHEHWLGAERDEDRRQIADLLVETRLLARARRSRWWRRAEPRCPTDPVLLAAWLAQAEPSPGTQRDILKVFLLSARAELRALEWRVTHPGLLASAARQAERHVWLGLLADPQQRQAAVYRYRSARWIAELRLSLLPAQPGTQKARELRLKVDAMAERPDVGSTALYNAACFTSVLADRAPRKSRERAELEEKAVQHLRRVARGGMGPVPSSGWLTTDPDLVALQAVPAFNDLVRHLADDEDRRETVGHA
jgi:hypothetical protein